MIPWKELGRADVPGEAVSLVLLQHGTEFVIRVGTVALMSSTAHGSEEMLAELVCARLGTHEGARVLIGGLGMGYTLSTTLQQLPDSAEVVVAELSAAVLEWNRGPLAHLAERPLEDPRARVRVADVVDEIRASRAAWDAIVLDVDNGPDGLTRAGNDRLYSAAGLAAAHDALKPGGVLGVWSVAPDQAFTRRLEQARFDVHQTSVRARRTKGGRHTLWIASVR